MKELNNFMTHFDKTVCSTLHIDAFSVLNQQVCGNEVLYMGITEYGNGKWVSQEPEYRRLRCWTWANLNNEQF